MSYIKIFIVASSLMLQGQMLSLIFLGGVFSYNAHEAISSNGSSYLKATFERMKFVIIGR